MQLNNGIAKWGKLSWNCFAICDVNNTTDPENVFFSSVIKKLSLLTSVRQLFMSTGDYFT